MNFSIIIPAYNRSQLLGELLVSLYEDRNYYQKGMTEVIVIDSSKDIEKENIMNSCQRFDTRYIAGPDSVRKKRNIGICSAKYEHIIFIDSDVTAERGLLDEYYKAYNEAGNNTTLGGVLGYTEFVGKKTFWWKVIELTPLVDAFSFAKKYPFHSWTIGNNVSFRTDVLKEIGMFEENFPFNLGGDDLDISYRVTKYGYMIASSPNAVTYHSRTTWNNLMMLYNRAKRWGTMENFISDRHPELYKAIIPKSYVIEATVWITSLLLSLLIGKWTAVAAATFWIFINAALCYILNGANSGFKNPIHYLAAQMIQTVYEFYRIKQSLKESSLQVFYKGLVYNQYQIKYCIGSDSLRIHLLLLTYIAVFLGFVLYVR